MRFKIRFSFLPLLWLFLAIGSTAFATQGTIPAAKPDKKDTAVEPTSWGRVIGQVYDAHTGLPIADAEVRVQQDGAFANTGRTLSKSDAMGRYQCEAIIGRASENFDLGRALSSGLPGLILGGATNQTRRVDVTRLNLRVTRDGYKPFEGSVLCKRSDPRRFTVSMQPVLLAAESRPEVSTSAEGWGVVRIVDVAITPAILHPDGHATVTVRLKSPAALHARDFRMQCLYTLGDRRYRQGLTLKETQPDGTLVFAADLHLPKSPKPQAGELHAVLTACPYDVAAGGDRKSALLQITITSTEEQAADLRSEAFRLLADGENAEAAARLKTLCALPDAIVWDYQQLAQVSQSLHDNATAVTALKRVVELTPKKPEMPHLLQLGRYAAALVSDGDGAKALDECEPVLTAIKERDRPARIPVPLMVAIGNAYLRENRLSQAESISRALLRWPDSSLYQSVDVFRNDLRLAQAQAKLKADPTSGQAHAEYGRVLMDQGRWEEAVDELRLALKADPNLLAVRRDAGYALLHMKGATEDQGDLDQSIASAEQQVETTDAKGHVVKSKDFFAWHKLALLLYSKACRQQSASDAATAATFAKSRNALREALRSARSGADVSDGFYFFYVGYMTPRVVAISAFAYPEANSDFLLLESLKALARNPEDYLALLDQGTALIDLGHADLAARAIRRVLDLKPDCLQAEYADALIALHDGDRESAQSRLRAVLQIDPWHPQANLTLARLFEEDGDTAAAAACLAAHARTYGTTK